MNSRYGSPQYIIRLDKGERLAESLQVFLAEHHITSAWISAIGGALEVELGFYNLETREYQWRTFAQTLEITSIQGNVALDGAGQAMLHLHGTFTDDNYQAIGGHIKDLVVGGTCEIVLQPLDVQLTRRRDDSVGLDTLAV